MKKLNKRQKIQLRRIIKDNLEVGDLYNDGTYSGRVTEISNDQVVVETQNENGDIVNVQIPIEDFLRPVNDSEDEFDEDLAQAARDNVHEENIYEIDENGFTLIDCPSEIEDIDEFAKECAFVAQDLADKLLGAPDQGYADILHTVEEGQVVLYVAQ